MQRTPSTPLRLVPPAATATPAATTAAAAPRHVAIIMDGNGRWATARGRPRTAGHLAGARAVRRTVDAALAVGLDTLTLYAFSADNWRRPADEVRALMALFRRHLAGESARCAEHGVRLQVVGRRDRLDPALVRAIHAAEDATAHGTRLRLRLAVDYSARDAIVRAALAAADDAVDPTEAAAADDAVRRARFAERLARAMHDTTAGATRDVDLLVRTGGEQRLSDFLLWECAYAELWFTPVCWPDFDAALLREAVAAFAARERRFGALPAAGGGSAGATRAAR
jgi:undecaprenyl diphosphate synthase